MNKIVPDDAQGVNDPLPAEAYKVIADVLGGGGKGIYYRTIFAHAFGGACNALLLSQLWYWTNNPTVTHRDGDGSFWKTQKDITKETGLTRTETLTARHKLAAQGVIEEEVRGVPATVHFRVVKDVLFQRLWAYILAHPAQFAGFLQTEFAENLQTESQETRKVVRGKSANKNAGKRQTITDTTSETTSKTTHPHHAPAAPEATQASAGEEEGPDDVDVVAAVALLRKERVSQKRADELARAYPLERIQRHVDALDRRNIKKSRAGTLIDSIVDDWDVPDAAPAPGSAPAPGAPPKAAEDAGAMPSARDPYVPPAAPRSATAASQDAQAGLDAALALFAPDRREAVLAEAHCAHRDDPLAPHQGAAPRSAYLRLLTAHIRSRWQAEQPQDPSAEPHPGGPDV